MWMHMRPALFWSYAKMLPKLQAEESLAQINVTGAGSGAMDEQAQKELLADLRRTANQGRKAPKATMQSLKAMGITVVTED